ncbi:hypothetical protein SDC9_75584 [bioreactor metagenome]|uniref:Uncharacterized protein n=1 Tax=bioreactor metagenome TaxID=1076179 RepID=A0A644YKE6_9ZZZZ
MKGDFIQADLGFYTSLLCCAGTVCSALKVLHTPGIENHFDNKVPAVIRTRFCVACDALDKTFVDERELNRFVNTETQYAGTPIPAAVALGFSNQVSMFCRNRINRVRNRVGKLLSKRYGM